MISSDPQAQPTTFDSDPQQEADPSFLDTWAPPQYVHATEVEVTPATGDQIWSPTFSEFSLPAAFLESLQPSSSAHAAQQGAPPPTHGGRSQSRPQPRPPKPQGRRRSEAAGAGTGAKGKKKKKKGAGDDDGCTLDEFWFEEGRAWNVQPPKRQSRKGLAGCETAPECHVCGTNLSIDEILNPVPCRVCGCFN
ncbi:hypothetical protein F5Y05DRAFT_415251 [Hypoxylon sp. FL0543]|nr:hypothetical protein F5Y05DRAFT_415251 [Hypoxylon sp. FL0543]